MFVAATAADLSRELSITRNDERQRTDAIMGYYDNEPQAVETESTTELATDTFDGVESQAAEAEGSVGLLRRGNGDKYY